MLTGGGLGNQMFQYALGRHLSIKNNQILKIDNSRYALVKQETYSSTWTFRLHHFNLLFSPASEEEIRRFKIEPAILSRFFLKLGQKRLLSLFEKEYYKKSFVREPDDHCHIFDPKLLNEKFEDAYFRGFWQSEKYFKDIRDVILQDFTVKTAPDEYNSAMLQEINKNTSVSLHIRRGNPDNHLGVLPFEYYRQAIAYVTTKIKNPHFYIFSDDVAWTKKNFKIDFPAVYVQNSLEKDYEDMRLMNRCKHHIIANSTFSWWGAWLCTHPEKIVIAPERYTQNIDRPNPDYYPESWVLIKNSK
jgi:hypothetical protein